MPQELLYTAAKNGLHPGSTGFCVVAQSAEMSPTLSAKLTELSAYQHPFPPGDRRNPVRVSWLRLNIGGQRIRVLSRVADVGLDSFTRRSNYLAHHLVFFADEPIPLSGPAVLARSPGLFTTFWSGEPRFLPANAKALPLNDRPPAPCVAWKETVGDAGWAGVLAEKVNAGETIDLIFPPETEMLPLLVEALALLSPTQRAEATFSTWANGLSNDANCRIRCHLEGTPEVWTVREKPHLDLSKMRHAKLPISSWVTAARTGNVEAETKTSAPIAFRSEVSAPPPAKTKPIRRAPADDEDDVTASDQDILAVQANDPDAPPALPKKKRKKKSKSEKPKRFRDEDEPREEAKELPEPDARFAPVKMDDANGMDIKTIVVAVVFVIFLVVAAVSGAFSCNSSSKSDPNVPNASTSTP